MIRFFKDICSFWIIPLIELIDAFHSYLHDFPINVHFRFPRKRKRKRKTEFRFRGKRNSVSVEIGIPRKRKTEFRGNGRRNFRKISVFRHLISVGNGTEIPRNFRGNTERKFPQNPN